MNRLCSRKAVLYDVANLAYVIGDVREGQYSPHTLHNTFDVCASGNIDRVNRIFNLAVAEVEDMMAGLIGGQGLCGRVKSYSLQHKLLLHLAHEYLVARVLSDWLFISFPPASATLSGVSSKSTDNAVQMWKDKAAEAYKALSEAVCSIRTGTLAFSRRIPLI